MDIRTVDGEIEAYVFERHVEVDGITSLKASFAEAPGVRFVGQFIGAFSLFARVVASDLGELQRHIAGEYWDAGIHSDLSINLTGFRPDAPKRRSPDICALVCAQTTADPFSVIEATDEVFRGRDDLSYGAAVVTAADFDLLIDLGAPTVEDVIDLVLELRGVPGIGRTSTALADLADNAIRPDKS